MENNRLKLVSVGLGKRLKELGFKVTWLCDYYNVVDKRQYGNWVGFSPELYEYYNNSHVGLPSLELAKQWFREEYEISVLLDCNASGWFWDISKVDGTHIAFYSNTGPNAAGQWDKYEETLEDGLRSACDEVKERKKNG